MSKFSGVYKRVKEMYDRGFSKFQIIESFNLSFNDFEGLTKRYFKSIVNRVFKENFNVYETIDEKIKYEFQYNQRNDDHLPIILDMFEQLLFSSDIDFTQYYEYPSGENEITQMIYPYGNNLVNSFSQIKKINNDNTVTIKWEIQTNNFFQKNKIINHMNNFLKGEKINVIKNS